tara:strand:+ start:223 stop:423 length:201 start_codon:yes stop_codon:yes gene_type:complete
MTKKKTKKEEEVDESERIVALEQKYQALENQLQQVVIVANNHIALCKEYEKTIAILSGRIRELNGD